MFIQQLINGITLGSIYALIALGYTLVYGILRMINFAHSEIFMIGAFLALGSLFFPGMNALPGWIQLIIAFLVAMIGSAIIGYLIERIAYKPLRYATRLAPLISAIGVSIFLQNIIFVWISNQSLPFPEIFTIHQFHFANSDINSLQIFIILISLILMISLHFFIQKTRLGKALRATASDRETAELLGINTHAIISLTFILGGALGGAGGLLNGMYYGSIKYNMGFLPGIKAFTAAVLGGVGNISGAVMGGLLIGILESLGAGYLPGGSEWKDIFSFAVLVLVLYFRPQGILGEKIVDKV